MHKPWPGGIFQRCARKMKLRRLTIGIISFYNFMARSSAIFVLYNLNDIQCSLILLAPVYTAIVFFFWNTIVVSDKVRRIIRSASSRVVVSLAEFFQGRAETSQKAQACVSHGASCHGMPGRLPLNMTQPGWPSGTPLPWASATHEVGNVSWDRQPPAGHDLPNVLQTKGELIVESSTRWPAVHQLGHELAINGGILVMVLAKLLIFDSSLRVTKCASGLIDRQ